VEFAVALPLLVVFVVGIFDFSGAFTLKQKLTNLARDAARAAAADPASDIAELPSGGVPASVSDALQMIDNYLVANRINDCGLLTTGPVLTAPATWTYSATGAGCPGTGLIITINRAYYFPQNVAAQAPNVSCAATTAGNPTVIATCVSLQYAYQWRFGRVESLLGATAGLPNSISAVSVAMNEN
jgi:Flp pilus assembly protein TadG